MCSNDKVLANCYQGKPAKVLRINPVIENPLSTVSDFVTPASWVSDA